MKKENCVRKDKSRDKTSKNIMISFRISKAMSEFLTENSYAPSLIFYEALRELGYKQPKDL